MEALPMTPLGLLNFLVPQWFGVRLARSRLTISHCDLIQTFHRGARIAWSNSSGKSQRCRVRDAHTLEWYSLLRWVWPLTGWWSDFRWIARRP
jgi:hypothetical protein